MSEWTVFEIIAAIVGLFLAVGVPIIKLISSITRLTVVVETIQSEFDSVTNRNTESHRRLWAKCDEQDRKIGENSSRIERLEGKVEGYHGE